MLTRLSSQDDALATCGWRKVWGECDDESMAWWCASTCDRCDVDPPTPLWPACQNQQWPGARYTCTQHMEAGHCALDWMLPFCQRTCGRCEPSGSSTPVPSGAVELVPEDEGFTTSDASSDNGQMCSCEQCESSSEEPTEDGDWPTDDEMSSSDGDDATSPSSSPPPPASSGSEEMADENPIYIGDKVTTSQALTRYFGGCKGKHAFECESTPLPIPFLPSY